MKFNKTVNYILVCLAALMISSCNAVVNDNSPKSSQNKVIEPQTIDVNLSNYGKVLYVDFNSESGDGSKENPFSSITKAINASEGKTAILIAQGTDTVGTINLKKDLQLFGGFNPTDWSRDIFKYKTVLDALHGNRLMVAAQNNTIDGFVLQNGKVRGNGGAILCEGVSPRITNNYILQNHTQGPKDWNPKYWHETANDGGAIYCSDGASPLIENNIFAKNTTENGRGGAFAANRKCKPIIRNNTFYGNVAGLNDPMRSSDAGAVSIFDWSDAEIEGNLFVSNVADSKNDGGALFIALWSSARIKKNIFVNNSSGDDAGAIFIGGQEHRYGGAPLDPLPPREEFFVSISDNILIGNYHGGINSGAMRFTMESRGEFINNRLAHNNGVYFQRSEVRVADNTILDNFLFIETKEGFNKGIIENNLIWAEYDQQIDAVVRNNNMLYPVEGNYSKPPLFVNDEMEIFSINSVYNRSKNVTTAYTNNNFEVNELANRAVKIGSKWTAIKSNDQQSITVWGNFAREVKYYIAPTYVLK